MVQNQTRDWEVSRRKALKNIALGSVVSVSGIGAFSSGVAAQSCDIVVDVDGGEDYSTIQAAVDNASAGAAICVEAGTYVEEVEVDKDVTVRGANDPDGNSAAVVDGFIEVSADGATVSRLKVAPSTTYTPANWPRAGSPFGILATGNDVVVEGNVVEGMTADASDSAYFSMNGIQVFHGGGLDDDDYLTGVVVRDNVVRDMNNQGDSEDYGGAAAIKVQGVLEGTDVIGNTVESVHSAGWTYGIVTTDTGNAPGVSPKNTTAERNTIEEVNDGSVYDVFDEVGAPYPGTAFAIDGDSLASEATANLNNFLQTPIGAHNKDEANTLDAECNYWDHATGPEVEGNKKGKGKKAVGDVDYTPWNTRKVGRGENAENSCVGGKNADKGKKKGH